MSFLFPAGLWLLAAIPALAALYLFRTRVKRRTVSNMELWNLVAPAKSARSRFRHFRRPYSFLLNLLILVLLVLALADPRFGGADSADSHVVVVDGGINMRESKGGGGNAFDDALRELRRLIESRRPGTRMAVLVADGSLRTAVPLTDNRVHLLRGTESLTASDGVSRPQDALRLARELGRLAGDSTTTTVLTNRPLHWIESASKDNAPRVIRVGANPAAGFSLTAFAARRHFNDPSTVEIHFEARGRRNAPTTTEVTILRDGELFDVRPVEVEEDGRVSETFQTTFGNSGREDVRLEARLNVDDANPSDNAAYAVVPSRPPVRVLLVGEGNWFLENLLRSDTHVAYEMLEPGAFRPDMAPGFDVVVLDAPDQELVEAAVSAGAGLLVFRGATAEGEGERIGQPLIEPADSSHPVLRMVDTSRIRVFKARREEMRGLDGNWRTTPLLQTVGGDPLVLAAERSIKEGTPTQRLVAFHFPLTHSDFVLRLAFPLMVGNAIEWIAHSPAEEEREATAGSAHAIQLAARAAMDPDPKSSLPNGRDAGFLVLPDEDGPRWYAIQPAAREADAMRRGDVDTPTPADSMESHWRLAPPRPWVWLVSAAAALLLAEWFLYHQRRTE